MSSAQVTVDPPALQPSADLPFIPPPVDTPLAPPFAIPPKEERMKLAMNEKRANPQIPVTFLSNKYGLPPSSLRHRLAGRQSREEYATKKQRLTPYEEMEIVRWMGIMIDWGCPADISQLKDMANHLLRARNDHDPVHESWYLDFLERHPEFKAKWSRAYDQSRKDAVRVNYLASRVRAKKATQEELAELAKKTQSAFCRRHTSETQEGMQEAQKKRRREKSKKKDVQAEGSNVGSTNQGAGEVQFENQIPNFLS